ncbi:MAG: replication-associated recombination protein A [Candidatus Hydrothermales bacterium]
MLFQEKKGEELLPLALRIAPKTLEDFVGQEHIIGENAPLRKLIEKGKLFSSIFYGPPGVGKTSLARLIAKYIDSPFYHLNASTIGVKDVRKALEEAERLFKLKGKRALLFIDEIHRFNRLQQEILLSYIEEGKIIFIGALILNPFFVLDKALISRTYVFEFKPLKEEDIVKIIKRALNEYPEIKIDEKLIVKIAKYSEGDARRSINLLEMLVEAKNGKGEITDSDLENFKLYFRYDRKHDEHYDYISAYIKSMRAQDADAALYYLFRMLEAGEDPRFIFRRMLIFACEDVGLADPQAIILINSLKDAFETVGMPEGEFFLTMGTIYLSLTSKSNSVLISMGNARKIVKEEKIAELPTFLRDASYPSAHLLGRGKGYIYPHENPNAIFQQYMKNFYPIVFLKGVGKEKELLIKLDELREKRYKFKKGG